MLIEWRLRNLALDEKILKGGIGLFHFGLPGIQRSIWCTSVMQVMASDADDPTYGSSARLVYSVLDGEHHFTVDPKTGEGRTAVPDLDRESQERYEVVIQATDMAGQLGGLSGSTTVTIVVTDVNDNPPRFPQKMYQFSIQESAPIVSLLPSGDLHGTKAQDFRQVTMALVMGDSDGVDDGDGAALGVMVAEVAMIHDMIPGVPMPKAMVVTVMVTVMITPMTQWVVMDGDGNSADNHAQLSRASLRIRILDVNDNPPELATPYEAAVCEDAKPGQLIQTISVVDRDEPQGGHRFYFRLVPEAPSNPHFSLLDIQDNTAAVHTQHMGFNRQEQDVFFLPILVVDRPWSTLSRQQTLTIRICGCDSSGTIQSCNTTAFVMAASLSPGALIALLVCVLILVAQRPPLSSGRWTSPTSQSPRNSSAVQIADTSLAQFPGRYSLPQGPPSPEPDFSVFRDFISRKVALADGDLSVPPYDAFQTYAFEGADSPAASLSSLHSGSSGSEQDFAYLSSWGPRFRPLAALYAGHRADDEAQAS
ncbi:LOW QUALITY PROTEIN: cadherin-22 [Puma concolor]|uniref:LOW QUALITY PROTEIN: cadherin-22 n=1 Tax=Puma concolor TaxID=9696 RepID=A0A6P6INC2_PUMCO|nr:LOW QUALITY PROTEIN: cadherin-22 [Puma concolor]